ncbi:MAG: hypothetical protein ABIL68_06610 [bacterium]
MKSKILFAGGVLAIAVSTFLLNSCTLIGLASGAAADAKKPDQMNIPGRSVETVKPGTQIEIVLKDGSQLIGKYLGLEHFPDNEYKEKYLKSLETLREKVRLPALDDSITITTISGKPFKCAFLGFDFRYLWMRMTNRNESDAVILRELTSIEDNQGNILTGETVRDLINKGEVPLLSAIVIQNETGKALVATDEVDQIQVLVNKYGAIGGFLAGAGIDMVLYISQLYKFFLRF